jgi:hypothetical protein
MSLLWNVLRYRIHWPFVPKAVAAGIALALVQLPDYQPGLLPAVSHFVGFALVSLLVYRILVLNTEPFVCPVCHGIGKLVNERMSDDANRFTSESCRSCVGTGVVWRPKNER